MEERSHKRRKINPVESRTSESPIERLPLELLEPIFLDSKNVNLLGASKVLRSRLSSQNARRGIITRCFRSKALKPDDFEPWLTLAGPGDKEYLCEQEPGSTELESPEDAMRDLTALLDEDWLSMRVLKDAIVSWMWDRASSMLRESLAEIGLPASDFEPASIMLREVLDKATTAMSKADIAYFQKTKPAMNVPCSWSVDAAIYPWLFSWPNPDASPKVCMRFLDDPWDSKTSLGYIRCTVVKKTENQKPHHYFGIWHRGAWWEKVRSRQAEFINWTCDNKIVPPRLLAGPWTQDRGDLLKFLHDQCTETHMDPDNFLTAEQIRAAQKGVTRALDDGNFLAIYMLLGRCSASCQSGCTHYVLHHGFASDAGLPIAPCSKVPDPWKHLSWSQEILPSLAVPLTTDHLRQAVDDYAAHPAASLQLLDHLANPQTEVPPLPPGFLRKFKAVISDPASHAGHGRYCEQKHTREWNLYHEFMFEAKLERRARQGPAEHWTGMCWGHDQGLFALPPMAKAPSMELNTISVGGQDSEAGNNLDW